MSNQGDKAMLLTKLNISLIVAVILLAAISITYYSENTSLKSAQQSTQTQGEAENIISASDSPSQTLVLEETITELQNELRATQQQLVNTPPLQEQPRNSVSSFTFSDFEYLDEKGLQDVRQLLMAATMNLPLQRERMVKQALESVYGEFINGLNLSFDLDQQLT